MVFLNFNYSDQTENEIRTETDPELYSQNVQQWIEHWHNSKPQFERLVEKALENSRCRVTFQSSQKRPIGWEYLSLEKREAFFAKSNVDTHMVVGDVLEGLKEFPELLGKLPGLLEFGRGSKKNGISRRVFIKKHLMSIPQFRALLKMAEIEIFEIWNIVVGIIKRASTWLWKRTSKFFKRIKKVSRFIVCVKHFEAEQEKLWPLLMAFKNN